MRAGAATKSVGSSRPFEPPTTAKSLGRRRGWDGGIGVERDDGAVFRADAFAECRRGWAVLAVNTMDGQCMDVPAEDRDRRVLRTRSRRTWIRAMMGVCRGEDQRDDLVRSHFDKASIQGFLCSRRDE